MQVITVSTMKKPKRGEMFVWSAVLLLLMSPVIAVIARFSARMEFTPWLFINDYVKWLGSLGAVFVGFFLVNLWLKPRKRTEETLRIKRQAATMALATRDALEAIVATKVSGALGLEELKRQQEMRANLLARAQGISAGMSPSLLGVTPELLDDQLSAAGTTYTGAALPQLNFVAGKGVEVADAASISQAATCFQEIYVKLGGPIETHN